MDPIKELLEECIRRNWVPKHECHFTAGERTEKINGKYVITKLKPKCLICGKESDQPYREGKTDV